MTTGKKKRRKPVFDPDGCSRCGECFHQCPELGLPLPEAQKEISRLIEGRDSKFVLAHCTTCLSCNLICPNGCHPYQLILERWNEMYQNRGAPPIYRFVCPTMNGNIWHMLEALLTPEEKEWTRRWTGSHTQGNVLLIGNYVHLMPFIVGDSRICEFFTVIDRLDHWECGAYLYQGGYLDVVRKISEKCRDDFKRWKIKTVVPLIDSVHWMLTEVIPREMKVPLDVTVVHYHRWVLEKIHAGEIIFSRDLNMTVTVHDNCYSKAGKGFYWDPPREILKHAGCRVTEMAHIREKSRCCGFGAGASWERPITILFDIMNVARRKLEEAEATGADALVSYCGGCLYLLWAARELFDKQIDIFHLVEIQRMAMGERLNYPADHTRRAWDIIAIITFHAVWSLFGRPFRIEHLLMEHRAWEERRFRGLQILRGVLAVSSAQYFFKKTFCILVSVLKSKRRWRKMEAGPPVASGPFSDRPNKN